MDKIGKKILTLLQLDSRQSNQELAEKVGLSPSPCLRRVKQLEEEGYIDQYVALLNPGKLGLQLTVFVTVGLTSHDPKKMAAFEQVVKTVPEVVQCHLIAGQTADYILKVIVPGLTEYRSILLDKITRIDGVGNVHSSFALNTIVDKTTLPLHHLK